MCENILVLRLLNFFNIALNVLRFVVPILLIIKLTLDVYKGILNPNENNFKEKVTRRLVSCVIIFLVPTIINAFLGILETVTDMKFDYTECMSNIKNIDYLIEKRELEEKLLYEKQSSESYQKYQDSLKKLQTGIVDTSAACNISNPPTSTGVNYEDNIKGKIIPLSNSNAQFMSSNSCSTDSMAIRIGEKYNVTDKELTDIAKVCQREQGRPTGAAAEAELMINKYVLSGYSGSLYDYLFNSSYGRWWHPIKARNYSSTNLRPEIKEAVRKVVVEGQRKYPAYIDEHDYFGDISKIVTNGNKMSGSSIKVRTNYIQNNTVIYNTMGSVYTFYAFPDEKSDPFGYTAKAKEKIDAMSR